MTKWTIWGSLDWRHLRELSTPPVQIETSKWLIGEFLSIFFMHKMFTQQKRPNRFVIHHIAGEIFICARLCSLPVKKCYDTDMVWSHLFSGKTSDCIMSSGFTGYVHSLAAVVWGWRKKAIFTVIKPQPSSNINQNAFIALTLSH